MANNPPFHPGVVRVTTRFQVGANPFIGTAVHFTYTGGPPTIADLNAMATTAYASAVSDLVPYLAAVNNLVGVEMQDLSSALGAFGSHLAVTAGTLGGAALPAGTCVLLNEVIARRYRGGKPRTYWPLGSTSELAGPASWTSGAVTGFETGIGNYLTAVAGLTHGTTALVAACSVSNYSSFHTVQSPITGRWRNIPTARPVAIPPDVLTTFTVNPIPGSQRRRLGA